MSIKIGKVRMFHLLSLLLMLLLCPLNNVSGCSLLVIENHRSPHIVCQIHGFSTTHQSQRVEISLPLHDQRHLHAQQIGLKTISQVTCDGLSHIGLDLSPFPHIMSLTPQQNNVLSVMLYRYIPSPNNNFTSLIHRIVSEFQELSPNVSLNIQLTSGVYQPQDFPLLAQIYDVIEFDTMQRQDWLPYLIPLNRSLSLEEFFPVSIKSVTINGQTIAVPSWLCTEFVFGRQPSVSFLKNWKDFLRDLQRYPSPLGEIPLATHLMHTLDLTSMYQKIVADIYGANALENMTYDQVDPLVISRLVHMLALCDVDGKDQCQHTSGSDAAQDFAFQNASRYMGYSESSFEVRSLSSASFYGGVFFPGNLQQAVFYVDAFGRSRRCNSSICGQNYNRFTAYMNQLNTREWIVFSQDCPPQTPPRRLLPGLRAFYTSKHFLSDGIYESAAQALPNATAFPPLPTKNRTAFGILIENALNLGKVKGKS